MEEDKKKQSEEGLQEDTSAETELNAGDELAVADGEKPLDRNVRLMSPARMVARRFFRSKLSVIGLVMIVTLLLFSWLGPEIGRASCRERVSWYL